MNLLSCCFLPVIIMHTRPLTKSFIYRVSTNVAPNCSAAWRILSNLISDSRYGANMQNRPYLNSAWQAIVYYAVRPLNQLRIEVCFCCSSSATHLHIISFKRTASHWQRITNRTIIINYCAVAIALASVGPIEHMKVCSVQTIWFFFCAVFHRVVSLDCTTIFKFPMHQFFVRTCQSNTDRRCEYGEPKSRFEFTKAHLFSNKTNIGHFMIYNAEFKIAKDDGRRRRQRRWEEKKMWMRLAKR